jgi:hypothetical protein
LVDHLSVQSTPLVRCPVSCHYRSTKIHMRDSYYCMMIGTDHSEVAPHCQADTYDSRTPHCTRRSDACRGQVVEAPHLLLGRK